MIRAERPWCKIRLRHRPSSSSPFLLRRWYFGNKINILASNLREYNNMATYYINMAIALLATIIFFFNEKLNGIASEVRRNEEKKFDPFRKIDKFIFLMVWVRSSYSFSSHTQTFSQLQKVLNPIFLGVFILLPRTCMVSGPVTGPRYQEFYII